MSAARTGDDAGGELSPWHGVSKATANSLQEYRTMSKTKSFDHTFRTLLLASTALLMAAMLSACNTLEGFGQDTEEAGEAIQGSTR
jgi:predicted small secreted protein